MQTIKKNTVLTWEIAGVIFIFTAGSLLHFVFDWLGQWKPIALIAAVNESVWEHLKLAFWPGVLHYTVEYKYLKKITRNFIVAKTAALYLAPIIIIVLFYSYTAVLGRHLLFLDILIFAIAVAAAQLASYKLLILPRLPKSLHITAVVFLVLIFLSFLFFTFLPPNLPLFEDSITGGYGIH
ncbi:MAG: DUF6512 family protein [Bacillota bacterium]|nr:DUF6512 family protein [Bacillota bacterium]